MVSQPLWNHISLCVAVTETMTMAAVTDGDQDVAVKPASEICVSEQSKAGHEGCPCPV